MQVSINRYEEEMYRRGDQAGCIESMISRFNRNVQNSGILKELKEHEHYEKPSVRRRKKHLDAIIREKKRLAKLAATRRDPKLERKVR
jgi:small subunit ribosomal protein S21